MKKWIVTDSEYLSGNLFRQQARELTMTSELEHLLDEGLENLEHAKTTDELRHAIRPQSPYFRGAHR